MATFVRFFCQNLSKIAKSIYGHTGRLLPRASCSFLEGAKNPSWTFRLYLVQYCPHKRVVGKHSKTAQRYFWDRNFQRIVFYLVFAYFLKQNEAMSMQAETLIFCPRKGWFRKTEMEYLGCVFAAKRFCAVCAVLKRKVARQENSPTRITISIFNNLGQIETLFSRVLKYYSLPPERSLSRSLLCHVYSCCNMSRDCWTISLRGCIIILKMKSYWLNRIAFLWDMCKLLHD